ncbi:MAG: TIGR03560 family F420-dependent LLM class oxidoreductase [Pseudomonadales bacterium]
MRFSFWPNPSQPYSDVLALAQHVERTGWDGFWYADHFMPNAEDTSAPWPEAWTTISAIAACVPRLRIGTLVTGNTYRHPAVLAKMAATLDHISEGRVVLGLGAGWQENEHAQYGLDFYDVPQRLARLDEACQVINSLYQHTKASFAGQFYQLTDATLEPKPIQQPLPLMVGGGGEKVTLRITAEHAHEWNVWGTVETLQQKMSVLDAHCKSFDRDPNEIQRSAVALLFMSDDEAYVAKMKQADLQQAAIIGSVEEVAEIIRQYEKIGVNELIVPEFTLGPMEAKLAILDTFIQQVAQR